MPWIRCGFFLWGDYTVASIHCASLIPILNRVTRIMSYFSVLLIAKMPSIAQRLFFCRSFCALHYILLFVCCEICVFVLRRHLPSSPPARRCDKQHKWLHQVSTAHQAYLITTLRMTMTSRNRRTGLFRIFTPSPYSTPHQLRHRFDTHPGSFRM